MSDYNTKEEREKLLIEENIQMKYYIGQTSQRITHIFSRCSNALSRDNIKVNSMHHKDIYSNYSTLMVLYSK